MISPQLELGDTKLFSRFYLCDFIQVVWIIGFMNTTLAPLVGRSISILQLTYKILNAIFRGHLQECSLLSPSFSTHHQNLTVSLVMNTLKE